MSIWCLGPWRVELQDGQDNYVHADQQSYDFNFMTMCPGGTTKKRYLMSLLLHRIMQSLKIMFDL